MRAGLSPVPIDHENHDDLMQARATALARLQVACSRLERASLEQRVATLDARLAHRDTSDDIDDRFVTRILLGPCPA